MKKRLVAIGLIYALSGAIAGCGGSEENIETTAKDTTVVSASEQETSSAEETVKETSSSEVSSEEETTGWT